MMDLLTQQVMRPDGRTYEIRVTETGHHIIAQAIEGLSASLELRILKRAIQEGVLLSKHQGDTLSIAQELAQILQGFIA